MIPYIHPLTKRKYVHSWCPDRRAWFLKAFQGHNLIWFSWYPSLNKVDRAIKELERTC